MDFPSTWQAFKALFEIAPEPIIIPDHAVSLAPLIDGPSGFRLVKDADGGWRFVAWVTNKYRDRDGEILAEDAHKEFVEYLDKGGAYPEAWLWHTPGTRWGQADFAEYVDGFLIVSGTVDPGMEAVAESLAKESDALGVSHGFYSLYSAPDTIGWYRMQELSPLPRVAAANIWTGMDLVKKEAAMAFSAAKREWLESKLGKERVASLEGDAAGMAKALDAAGVDYKDMPADATAGSGASPASPVMTDQDRSDLAATVVKAFAESPAIIELAAAVKATGDTVAALKAAHDQLAERMKALEKSDDEKLTDLIKARVTAGVVPGARASQSEETVLSDADKALATARPMIDPAFMKAFQGL